MDTLLEQIDALIRSQGLPWTRRGNAVTVLLPGGQRRQRVLVSRREEVYVFKSTILGADDLPEEMSLEEVAYRAWRRNTITEYVAFTFDEDEALVGVIEQPSATVDREELRGYIETLAAECDRFQYALSGADEE